MILISSQREQQEICHFSCTEKKTELDRYLIISDSTGPRTWVVRYPGPSCCHSIPQHSCHQLCCYRIWPGEFTQGNLGKCSLPERKVSKGCLSHLTLFIQWAPGSTISSKKRERHPTFASLWLKIELMRHHSWAPYSIICLKIIKITQNQSVEEKPQLQC